MVKFRDGLALCTGGDRNINNYFYIGADTTVDDTHSKRLIEKLGTSVVLPEHKAACVCGHAIERNYYVKHCPSQQLIVVGSDCITKFMSHGTKRVCAECRFPTRNRNQPLCNDCLNKKAVLAQELARKNKEDEDECENILRRKRQEAVEEQARVVKEQVWLAGEPKRNLEEQARKLEEQAKIEAKVVHTAYWGSSRYEANGDVKKQVKVVMNEYYSTLSVEQQKLFSTEVCDGRGWGADLIRLATKFRSKAEAQPIPNPPS